MIRQIIISIKKHTREKKALGMIVFAAICRNRPIWALTTGLLTALSIEPNNIDFLYALADHYIKNRNLIYALKVSKSIQAAAPANPLGKDLER